jgi:methyl-accepting chemotaxis protein
VKSLNDIAIGKRLIGGIVGTALMFCLAGGFGMLSMHNIQQRLKTIYNDRTVPLGQLHDITTAYGIDVVNTANRVRDGIMTAEQGTKVLAGARARIDSTWNQYLSAQLTEEEAIIVERMRAAKREADEAVDTLSSIVGRNDLMAITTYASMMLSPAIDPVLKEAEALSTLQIDVGRQNYGEAQKAYLRAVVVCTVVFLFALVCAAVVGWTTSRSIAGRLGRVVAAIRRLRDTEIANVGAASRAIARGDFTAVPAANTPVLQIASNDEVGVLAADIDEIIASTHTSLEAFSAAQSTLRQVMEDSHRLTNEAAAGNLAVRIDAARYQGGFHTLTQGLNATLDAVVAPVQDASVVLKRIAARDLTTRVTGDFKGDHATIKTAINDAVTALSDALAQVASGAEQVSAAATQISSGSQSLAEGSSEQASSLEEVSSSLQEMASMTRQNAGNAKEGRGLAENARDAAGKGVESMQRLSDAIERIKGSADSTAKIVKTIDEIAFQTNLLALNAAVEAARAGEAGKGFAVVAEEVRNLAMRSAEAAKNTASLIEESVRNADGGVQINREVSGNLEEINIAIGKVRDVMSEIAAASEQQDQGIGQITMAVEQMNSVTQRVAANAEESASASEELSSQAEVMKAAVGSFAIDVQRTSGAAVTRKPQSASTKAAVKRSPKPAKTYSNGHTNGHAQAEDLIPFGEDDLVLSEF